MLFRRAIKPMMPLMKMNSLESLIPHGSIKPILGNSHMRSISSGKLRLSASGTGEKPQPVPKRANDLIKKAIKENDIVLFMKGTPGYPMCGFSKLVVQALQLCGAEKYHAVDVLSDDEVRSGIKTFSDWPTIPQLYVRGEFIGGADIVRQLYESGELKKLLVAAVHKDE